MKINLTLPIKVENRENPIITMPKTSGVKVVKQGDLEITLTSVFKKKKMEQPKEEPKKKETKKEKIKTLLQEGKSPQAVAAIVNTNVVWVYRIKRELSKE